MLKAITCLNENRNQNNRIGTVTPGRYYVMNPLLAEIQLDNEQRQDDILRKAGLLDMADYVDRLQDRRIERRLAKMRVVVFIRGNEENR